MISITRFEIFKKTTTVFTRNLFLHFLRRMTQKVFVYGTLKRNEPNHHWLSNPKNGFSEFVTNGKTSEIYEVDKDMMANLDVLEDHPNYYIREIENVDISKGGSNETIKCWIYFMKNFKEELLSRQMFESYSSSGSHGLPYMESNNESTIDDLNEDSGKTKSNLD